MNLKKNVKVFTSKSVGTGPSSYEKRIYRAAVSQSLRNTDPEHLFSTWITGALTLYSVYRILSKEYSQVSHYL